MKNYEEEDDVGKAIFDEMLKDDGISYVSLKRRLMKLKVAELKVLSTYNDDRKLQSNSSSK